MSSHNFNLKSACGNINQERTLEQTTLKSQFDPLLTSECSAANGSSEPALTNAAHVTNVCIDDFVSENFGGQAFLSTYTDTCHLRTHVNQRSASGLVCQVYHPTF